MDATQPANQKDTGADAEFSSERWYQTKAFRRFRRSPIAITGRLTPYLFSTCLYLCPCSDRAANR